MIERATVRTVGRGALLALLLGCWALLLVGLSAARGETAIVYTHESYPQYQSQLASGQIKAVTVNRRVRSLRITLDNGTHVVAHYAPKQEPAVVEALEAKGVPVTLLALAATKAEASSKPVHHKLRYIAGGLLLAVVVIVGVVLFVNRRRKALAD